MYLQHYFCVLCFSFQYSMLCILSRKKEPSILVSPNHFSAGSLNAPQPTINLEEGLNKFSHFSSLKKIWTNPCSSGSLSIYVSKIEQKKNRRTHHIILYENCHFQSFLVSFQYIPKQRDKGWLMKSRLTRSVRYLVIRQM